MNTYNRSQGMDNRLNMLFNQELDNEAQYIKSHPFSSINMSLGGEVRYIAPIWPWNAPRFQALDWRLQPPPRRLPGETKHDRGNIFELPKTWNETTNQCWGEETKPPACFPHTRRAGSSSIQQTKGDHSVTMTGGALRSQNGTPMATSRNSRNATPAGTPGRTPAAMTPGREPPQTQSLSIDKPVSMLPGRPRPETGASGGDRSSRLGTARSSRMGTARSNTSARVAAKQLME